MAVNPPPQRGRKAAILGGLLVAVLGVAGTVYLSKSQTSSTGGPAVTNSGSTTTVVIASVAIPFGSKITLSNITTAQMPSANVPEDHLKDPNQANGLYAAVNISPNTTLVPSLLVQAPQTTPPLPINPIQLKDGEVAVSIPNDPAKGAGGFIQAGDHIDIMVDVNGAGAVKYAFQNVVVLKAAANAHAEGAASDLLLIALPRRQAEELGVILGGHGTNASIIRYVLRPASQNDKGYLPSGPDVPEGAAGKDTPSTPQQLSQLFAV